MKLTQVTFLMALAVVAGAAPALVVLDQDAKPDGSGAGPSVAASTASTASSRPGPQGVVQGAVPGAPTSGNFSVDRGLLPSGDDVGDLEPASFAMCLAGMLAAGRLVRSRLRRA